MHADVLALFRELAERSSAEREAYYTAHHIDAALRAEVESLLRFDSEDESLRGCVAAAAEGVVHGPLTATVDADHPGGAAAERALSLDAALTGRRLGAFEVLGLLGAGGMGRVYRALDTRLGREVAIKILPPEFRDDRAYAVRFEREARLLAALNHPHIAVVHGLEEVEGLKALVMELVDGEDLSDRLAQAPLPLSEALDVARQIAEALEAAHAQGIVHRDLKPSNVKQRRDGTVKVLDFGLAKTLVAGESVGVTQAGTIAGTPAYMSPEQARGDPVDSQADIWSFGVVLFELLTGVSPFARRTTAETLACVLSEAPDYSLLPAQAPPTVRHVIRRCLERDRRRRLKHIGDARIDLEEVPSQSGALAYTAAPAAVANNWKLGQATAVAAAALIAGAVVGAFWLAPRTAPSPVVRTIIPADILVSHTDRSLAFTPDSRSLAYVSSDARQILVRPLNALEPFALLTTAAYIKGVYPSPDGRWLGYIENNFTLKKISTGGGVPVTVVEFDGPSRGAAWGPDDTVVFATGAPETGLQRVASTGGAVTVLTRPDSARSEEDHVNPSWLPDGRRVLFTIRSVRGGPDAAKIAVLDLETGVMRTVLEGGYAARYVESGYIVYAAAGALWATRFNLPRLETEGSPAELVRPVIVGTGTAIEVDIARDGTLAYSRGATSSDRRVPVWLDRQGRETPLPAPPGIYRHLRLSPDGKRIAVDPVGGGQGDIYIWDVGGSWSSALRIAAPGNDWFPVWTPDGRKIAFGSWRAGGFSNLYLLDLETGSTKRLTDSPDMQCPTSMTPDGRTVIFHSFTKSLQSLRLDGHEPITLVETPLEERNGELSPDGRWLAYEGESPSLPGQLDVYVRPFPDVNRAVWQVTRDGGTFPLWSRNGRELFYAAPDGTIVAVPVDASGMTWKAGTPKELFRGPYAARDGSLGRLYDVAPDGRFLMLKHAPSEHAPHVVVVQNWLNELTRQVH